MLAVVMLHRIILDATATEAVHWLCLSLLGAAGMVLLGAILRGK